MEHRLDVYKLVPLDVTDMYAKLCDIGAELGISFFDSLWESRQSQVRTAIRRAAKARGVTL